MSTVKGSDRVVDALPLDTFKELTQAPLLLNSPGEALAWEAKTGVAWSVLDKGQCTTTRIKGQTLKILREGGRTLAVFSMRGVEGPCNEVLGRFRREGQEVWINPIISYDGKYPVRSRPYGGARVLGVAVPRFSTRIKQLQKSGGRTRRIEAVPKWGAAREALREVTQRAYDLWDHLVHDAAHGFKKGRSPLTAALVHRGYRWTMKLDIKDFFDNVPWSSELGSVTALMTRTNVDLVAAPVGGDGLNPRGFAQGMPLSPLLSNLALVEFDKGVSDLARKYGVAYTRYADDLCFSSKDRGPSVLYKMKEYVEGRLRGAGLELREDKTRLMDGKYARRVVLGISVGDDVRIPKRVRHRLRGRLHADPRHPTSVGLKNWVDLVEAYKFDP